LTFQKNLPYESHEIKRLLKSKRKRFCGKALHNKLPYEISLVLSWRVTNCKTLVGLKFRCIYLNPQTQNKLPTTV